MRARLSPRFARQGLAYPPDAIALIGFKEEKRLELYARKPDGTFRFVHAYPILAASGTAGPKMREGDWQVPEGFYAVEALNPNSRFHLALRVGYPNEEDKRHAAAEGRPNLGGDIMIHGGQASVGCLAIGDTAAEDVFVLAAQAGSANVDVLLCPVDFRLRPDFQPPASAPSWAQELYGRLKRRLQLYSSEHTE